jgi:hypothetical protein
VSSARTLRPDRGSLRAARCLLVTVPSVAVGATAHAVGDGCVSGFGIVLAAIVLSSASWTQLSRERSGAFFVAWTALGQAVVHGVLTVTCSGTTAQPSPAGHRSLMLVAHALAVLAMSLLLRRGDARVWAMTRLARELRGWLVAHAGSWRVLRPVLVEVRLRQLRPAPVRTSGVRTRVQGRPARRGPPAACRP